MHWKTHFFRWRLWLLWFILIGMAATTFWALRFNPFMGLLALVMLLGWFFGTERTEDKSWRLKMTNFLFQMVFLTA